LRVKAKSFIDLLPIIHIGVKKYFRVF